MKNTCVARIYPYLPTCNHNHATGRYEYVGLMSWLLEGKNIIGALKVDTSQARHSGLGLEPRTGQLPSQVIVYLPFT
jgi:hypothetical protein